MLRTLATGMLLLSVLAPAVSADWTSFHGDDKKTGFQSGTDYQVYKDVWWNVKVNSTIESSPVVSAGIVVIGGWDKVVRAFDAASGAPKWTYTMTDKIVGSPAISSGRVYAVDVKGALVSLDLLSGKKYAEAAVGATLASVTAHEGKLFIGTEAGEMKAFDVESSDSVITLLWTFALASFKPDSGTVACVHPKGQIRAAAAVHGGLVYFGAMNNYVYAINEEGESDDTTRAQWFNLTGDIILTAPSIDSTNNNVYFASYDGKVRSFSITRPNPATCVAANRLPVWTYSAPSNAQIRSSPAVDGTRIYFGTNSGHVIAISTSGAELWTRGTGNIVVSSPAVSNGVVVVGSDDKNVYWLSATNGSVLRQFASESVLKSSPALDGARAFVASFDGTIYMFGPQIPTRPDLAVTSIAIASDGISVTVKNQGDAASTNTTVRLLKGGTFVANVDLAAIDAGQSKTVTFTLSLTASSAFKAIADPDGLVTESVESNNEKSQTLAPPVTVPPTTTEDKGGGGFKIPAVGLAPTLALLALAALAIRRRR
ncbi:MAG: PQQ-binding-like beta-propeller repeat protein [Candidatus Thermoplasmatota archaeon]|jgi:outer membrane protein assembly factor BamB